MKIFGNNIGVDPNIVCHFSGKPSTTCPTKRSIYFKRDFEISHVRSR